MGTVEDIGSSEHGNQLQRRNQNLDGKVKEEENILKFLDSLDDYLRLVDSLSSSLRQGWLELASARHSMGASRVNTALFDLKSHQAATRLLVTHNSDADHDINEPRFTLCKWVSSWDKNSKETRDGEDGMQKRSSGLCTQDRDASQSCEVQDESSQSGGSHLTSEELVRKERRKSLAVFGALVSPRLGEAQLSFETALEKLVEIANARSSLLLAFDQLQKNEE